MQELLSRYRSPEERGAWNQMLELIPRGRQTRGLHFEVLEFLFQHLYERISETQIRDHLLEVRGRLQPTGDPVKVAINLAIKELQRLPAKHFEIIKIQEPNPHGKQIRYVQLNFTPFHGMMHAGSFQAFMRALLFEQRPLTIRMVCQHETDKPDEPFPGVHAEWFHGHHVTLLANSKHVPALDDGEILAIPSSPANENLVLIYANDSAHLPALAFQSDVSTAAKPAEALFHLYRMKSHGPMIRLLNERWHALYDLAVSAPKSQELHKQAEEISALLARNQVELSVEAAYQGLLADAVTRQRNRLEGLGS